MATAALTSRTVQSTDPSLSAEANRLVTDELRKVIGRDEVDVPIGRADHRSDRHAVHTKLMAAAIQIRIELLLVGTIIAMTALIAIALNTGSSWLTGISLVLLLPIVAYIAWSVMRLFSEAEHLSPEIAAQLSAEGVGDPDRYFNELLHDFDR
jgi:hypothetical protein